MTELHGDIWGPKGIEKDPVYTYRPLNASALIGTGSPGSSLNSREGVITSSAEKLPGSPRDLKKSGKASSLGSKERLDSPRDSVSTASTGGSTTSTSTASPPATKSKKTGKVRRGPKKKRGRQGTDTISLAGRPAQLFSSLGPLAAWPMVPSLSMPGRALSSLDRLAHSALPAHAWPSSVWIRA